MVAAKGLEPPTRAASKDTESLQNSANCTQNNALETDAQRGTQQNSALPIQSHSTSQQPICVWDVYDADLAKVVAAWDSLSPDARRHIVDLVAQRK